MKKIIYILVGILLVSFTLHSIQLDLGLMYGSRTMSDSDIKNTYGNGMEFNIYLDAKMWKGFTIGAGFISGYSEKGEIGIYNEDSTLKMNGFEIFAAWQFKLKKLVPYFKL